MKTVGVVIPIYNVEKYLRECLDSVVNQTYKNLQVVLVNDGSTDENSLNIAKEYTLKDERFILFDKENGGQSTARNVGIEFFSKEYDFKNITQELKENSLAEFKLDNEDNPYNIYKIYKSSNFFKNKDELLNFKAPDIDYIIFLDSDDYWELNCIEECVPRMDGVEVVWFNNYFDYFIEDNLYKDNLVINKSFIDIYDFLKSCVISKQDWLEIQKRYKYANFAFVCVGVIDFNFLKKIKLKFLDHIIHEDHHFGILLFLQSNYIYVLTKKLYHYRITTNTTCAYDKKITKANIPKYIDYIFNEFNDIQLTKKYFMLSSILINALAIMDYIKKQEEPYRTDIEFAFFDFLYMYHFGLYDFKKDPWNMIAKIKNMDIISLENKKRYPEFYIYRDYGTAVQSVKNSLSYKIGNVIVNSFKNKIDIFKLPYLIYKIISNHKEAEYLPIEAFPDYESGKKITNFLSYKIGDVFVNTYNTKFGLVKIPYLFFKTYINFKKRKNKKEKNISSFKNDNLPIKKDSLFNEYDLIDVFYGKKVNKNYSLNSIDNYVSWTCDIHYECLLETIKIKFNSSVNIDDIKVYISKDWYNFELISKELYIHNENLKEYNINISSALSASIVKIVLFAVEVELEEIQIFKRKIPGYVVSAKPDAFGMRLAGILIGMYLARQIGFKFAFAWKNNIDVDFLNVQHSVNTNEIHYLGNAMEDANIVFDNAFLDKYLINSDCVAPSWGHNLGFKQRTLEELKNGQKDEVWGWYATDVLPSKWIKDCDEKKSLKQISDIYKTIEFSDNFLQIINDVEVIVKNILKRPFVAIHIRGGEIIFSDSRKLPGWCIVRERYFPYEIALELALLEIKNGNLVIIFGQDLKANKIMSEYIANLMNNKNFVSCVDDFIDKTYTDMERSFFDMNLMSHAKKIYSAKESVFSKVSMMISGENNLISYHNMFDLQEQYKIIEKNMFKMNLHKLHSAMAYYRLYELSKQLKKDPALSFNLINKALEYDFENDAYRIYIIDHYLQNKEYEKAEVILKYVFENRKDLFLKNFFDNSCGSFKNEYQSYLSLDNCNYKCLKYIKDKILQFI
nr:glycosyltransferase family 2 protein [Campylobacter jejuni]